MIITLNTKLLGGHLSLLQCMCLLGYCLFPVNIASLLTRVIFTFLPAVLKMVIVAVSFMWSTKGNFLSI
jgi:protein YIPF6